MFQLFRPSGDLEDEHIMDTLPQILSASAIKDTIQEKCRLHKQQLLSNQSSYTVSIILNVIPLI